MAEEVARKPSIDVLTSAGIPLKVTLNLLLSGAAYADANLKALLMKFGLGDIETLAGGPQGPEPSVEIPSDLETWSKQAALVLASVEILADLETWFKQAALVLASRAEIPKTEPFLPPVPMPEPEPETEPVGKEKSFLLTLHKLIEDRLEIIV